MRVEMLFVAVIVAITACSSSPIAEPLYQGRQPTEDDEVACSAQGVIAGAMAEQRDAGTPEGSALAAADKQLATYDVTTDRERQALTRAKVALPTIVHRVYQLTDLQPATLKYLVDNNCMLDASWGGGHSSRNEQDLLKATRVCQANNPPNPLPEARPNDLDRCIKMSAIGVRNQNRPPDPNTVAH